MAARPPHPLASLTLSSSSRRGSSDSDLRRVGSNDADDSSGSIVSGSSGGGVTRDSAGRALTDLLASAVPLHVTVQL